LELAAARPRLAGTVDIDALERGREAVRVALASHLAVAHDIDARSLHIADCQHGGIVLRLLEQRLRYAPEGLQSNARGRLRRERPAVDEPVRLRIAADHGRGQEGNGHGYR